MSKKGTIPNSSRANTDLKIVIEESVPIGFKQKSQMKNFGWNISSNLPAQFWWIYIYYIVWENRATMTKKKHWISCAFVIYRKTNTWRQAKLISFIFYQYLVTLYVEIYIVPDFFVFILFQFAAFCQYSNLKLGKFKIFFIKLLIGKEISKSSPKGALFWEELIITW